MSDAEDHMDMSLASASTGREEDVTREVKAFYEKIMFPGSRPMEQDSLIFFRKFARLAAGQSTGGGALRVLDAGCGTGNTTLELAKRFPDVEFTGVDLSASSVARARHAAEEQSLENARFYEWNLLQPMVHEPLFDIVLCFGVLHHTAEMRKALGTIRAALRHEGRMFLWVYGAYGRYRHTLNNQLLAMLISADSSGNPVAVAREFIESAGGGMAARDLLGPRSTDPALQNFFTDPTWIADQFLHPNELVLTMRDLLSLADDADLLIAEWIGAPKDVRGLLGSDELVRRYDLLPERERLFALDLLLKPDRYFLVLRNRQKD